MPELDDLKRMPLHMLCYTLDELCKPFWFTFSGRDTLYVSTANQHQELAKFVINEDNPIEYVVTKIILQFSGGTIPA